MNGSDGVRILSAAGPVTVVRTAFAAGVDRDRALTRSEALAVLLPFFRLAGYGDERRGLCDIHRLVDSAGSVGYQTAKTRVLAHRVSEAIGRGYLLVVDGWNTGGAWTPAQFDHAGAIASGDGGSISTEAELVRKILGRRNHIAFEGERYVVVAAPWRNEVRGRSRLQVVHHEEAATTLRKMAARAPSPEVKAALGEAAGLLADTRTRHAPNGLFLARQVAPTPASAHADVPVSTPSDLRRMAPPPAPAPAKPKVNPVLTPVKVVVLVLKRAKNPAGVVAPYTTPTRQKLTLKTDANFDGTGTFSSTGGVSVKFFRAATGGAELKLDGKDNVFPGADLTGGVDLFAEGNQASAAMDDITVKLALSGGSSPVGPDATATITSVELTLDICNSRVSGGDPAPLSTDDKVHKGRFLHKEDRARYYERAKLIVRATKPAAFAADLELVPGPHVKLFAAEKWPAAVAPAAPAPEAPLVAPVTVPAAGVTYWLDGDALSGELRDATVTLGVKGGEPEGDKVTATVVKVTFSKSPNMTWGYDDLDKAILETHHISTRKNDFTVNQVAVEGPITGAGAPANVLFFTTDDASIAEAAPPASLAASFDLRLNGKDQNKAATNIHARINDRDGPICATVRVHVYKLKEVTAKVVKLQDSASATTALTRPRFDVAAAQDELNKWYKAAVCKITLTDHSATGDAIDVRYDLNGNGRLDIEPAATSNEVAAVTAAFNPAGQKVVIVKDLAWIYYLKTAAAVGDLTIVLKDAYSGYMKFIGVGSSYDLGSGANQESINVASKAGQTITLSAALTKAHPTTDGLIWPLSGLSGNPIWVAEQGKTEAKQRETIGHENGHSLMSWADLEASNDLMHYSLGRTDTVIRYKELPKKYDAGNEVQWDAVPR